MRRLEGLPVALEESAILRAALTTGLPHNIMDTLLAIMDRPGGQERLISVLTKLPSNSFTELLRCLDPKQFIDRYKLLHMEVSPKMTAILGLADVMNQDGVYTFFKTFLDNLNLILETRHLFYDPIASDYKYLLKCARATGNLRAAHIIWDDFTEASIRAQYKERVSDEVEMKLDVESYNNYLGVLCWHDIMKPHQRHKLRFIPQNVIPRSWATAPYTLSGHSIGQTGIKLRATQLFRQMVNDGLSGNEETFCLMMVSLGREGDVAGVASILKRVWGIDVQVLMTSNNIAMDAGTKYSVDSPFYPTPNLLFTIAHVYGINNSLPTALRLVDFVSRRYSIPILNDVWNELLNWTFVLSVKHRRSAEAARRRGIDRKVNAAGSLPKEAVLNLWNTMVSEPYNVKPTMEMYNRLIINLSYRQHWGEMQVFMEEALQLYRRDCLKLYQQLTLHNFAMSGPRPSQSLQDLRNRDTSYVALRVARNKEYIRRWVKCLLRYGSRSLRGNEEFVTRSVPKIINEWHTFLKKTVRYDVLSGKVQLGTKTEKNRRYRRNATKHGMKDSERYEVWLGRHWRILNLKRARRRAELEVHGFRSVPGHHDTHYEHPKQDEGSGR